MSEHQEHKKLNQVCTDDSHIDSGESLRSKMGKRTALKDEVFASDDDFHSAFQNQSEKIVRFALLVDNGVGIGSGLIFIANADHAHNQAVLHQATQYRL